ncbi:MAG: ATP-binding cassette domain-containing protein [Nakamurella sp.]
MSPEFSGQQEDPDNPGVGSASAEGDPTGSTSMVDPKKKVKPAKVKKAREVKKAKEVKKPEVQTLDLPPGPVLVASGLGLLTKNGWIFQDINLELRSTTVAAVVGPAGTGKSSLLLALTGRMAANTGTLTVAGHSMADKPAAIRAITAVARIGAVADLEPGLTVSEAISEHCLTEDVNALVGRARFDDACIALGLTFNPTELVATLVGDLATLFSVALACVRIAAVIVLDDFDRGVSAATQQRMLDALIRLAATGPTIVLATTDRIPVMDADVVLDLTPQDGAALWQIGPEIAPPGNVLRQLDPGGQQRDPAPPDGNWAVAQLDRGHPTGGYPDAGDSGADRAGTDPVGPPPADDDGTTTLDPTKDPR